MASGSLKEKTLTSLLWNFGGKSFNQLVAFVISVLLARVLLPKDFGLIAMVMIFTQVIQVFQSFGFGVALIQDRETTQKDWSTVFYFNIFTGLVLTLALFLLATPIAKFYGEEELVPITRLISFNFLISSFGIVFSTQFKKNIDFKSQMIVDNISSVVAGVIAYIMVMQDFGVYSLVAQSFVGNFINVVMLWWFSSWKPSLVFEMKSLKKFFSFSMNVMGSEMINRIFENVDTILVGKYISPVSLGYYNRAKNLRGLPLRFLTPIVGGVLFPVLSSIQDEDERIKRYYMKVIHVFAFVIIPLMLFGVVLAEPLVVVLYTEKWRAVIPMFQLLCITGFFIPLGGVMLSLLTVKGRMRFQLRFDLIKRISGFLLLLFGLQWGLYGILYVMLINQVIGYFFNIYYTGRLINFRIMEHLKIIAPYLLFSALIGALVYFLLPMLSLSLLLQLIIGMLFAVGAYFSLCYIFKLEAIRILVEVAGHYLKRKN